MVAVGFNIIYNVTEIINFAQGEFVMLGGLIMVFLHVAMGLPLILAFPATIILVTLVGILLDRLAHSPHPPAVGTYPDYRYHCRVHHHQGNGGRLFGARTPLIFLRFPAAIPSLFWEPWFNPSISGVIGFLIITAIALSIFFDRTIIGKAMSACADNPDAASLVGINVKQMILLSFALSAAIGAVAGITITPISLMEYDRGAMLAVKGFAAAILGGLGSFPGAILGGLIMGSIESFGAGLVSSGYKDAFALIVLLVILFFKPSGLMGSIEISKIKKVLGMLRIAKLPIAVFALFILVFSMDGPPDFPP